MDQENMNEQGKTPPIEYMLFVNKDISQVHVFVSTEYIPPITSLPAHFKHNENEITIKLDELREIIMRQPELTWVINNQATEQNYLWLLFFMNKKKIEHVIKLDVMIDN